MSETLNAPPRQDAPMPNPQGKNQEEDERRAGAFWWWKIGAGFLIAGVAVVALVSYSGYLHKKNAEKQRIENAFVFRIDGQDSQSRRASFDFIVMSNEYSWVIGSANQVSSRGQVVPEDEVVQRVVTPRIREIFGRSPDLIAVGLASREGDRAQEEERANRRADTVASWMEKFSNPPTRIWKLTLGQYDKSCKDQEDADTSFERPLIMVSVRSKDPSANLQQALANAISGLGNLPDRHCYSRFDLSKNH